MRTPSAEFKTAMKQPIKELKAYIEITATDRITESDDLKEWSFDTADVLAGQIAMRHLKAKYLGRRVLIDKWVTVALGVKKANGFYEYLRYGQFLITRSNYNEEKDYTEIEGYDEIIKTMIPYDASNHSYPLIVASFAFEIEAVTGIKPISTDIGDLGVVTINDLFKNITNTNYRNIYEEIAGFCGFVGFHNDKNANKLGFASFPKSTDDTSSLEVLTYSELMKAKLYDRYGVVNSLTLSRQPQNDNVVYTDVDFGVANPPERIEHIIVNNQFIENYPNFDRADLAQILYTKFENIQYTPFYAETEGHGWYQIGDHLKIEDGVGTEHVVIVTRVMLKINGGIKEILECKYIESEKINYKTSGGITNRQARTELEVDKQKQLITSNVSDIAQNGSDIQREITEVVQTLSDINSTVLQNTEEISEIDDEIIVLEGNLTNVEQDIDSIVSTIQKSGGGNLIKNSAFFSYNFSNEPDDWTAFNSGSHEFFASSEAVGAGAISGHVVKLNNKGFYQDVAVSVDHQDIAEDDKIYYSLSARVKKNMAGTGYIEIVDGTETHRVSFTATKAENWTRVELSALLATTNSFRVRIYGQSTSDLQITDLMLVQSKYASNWEQSVGETMNTQVNIHQGGIIVKSSVFLGDYTVISPLEFSGYSNVNGVITKVFTLNKDVTEVKKLQADDEIAMDTLKIINVNNATNKGWAFVKAGS